MTGFFLHLAFQRRKTVVERNRLQTITSTMSEGLYVADSEGRLSFMNPEGRQLLGYTTGELVGANGHELFHRHGEDDTPASQCRILQTALTGQVYRNLEFFRRKDGEIIPVDVTASPMMQDEQVMGVVTVFRDVTEHQRVEADLQRAKNQAEAANLTKSRFLANMSHELRTPFNGIMGMLQLLETTGLDGEQREYVEEAVSSSRRFVNLLGNILDFSSMEAGELDIHHDTCDMHELVEAVSTVFGVRARQNGVEFTCSIQEGTPHAVVADAARVRQVLFCLLDNAVKFTRAGHIRVGVAPALPEAVDPADFVIPLTFTIADTGIGIPEVQLQELFAPFTQADSSYTRAHQGAGLGLVIAAKLVALMEGTLTVDSEVERGTTIRVTIPFGRLPGVPAGQLV